jgi:hypothetical protein
MTGAPGGYLHLAGACQMTLPAQTIVAEALVTGRASRASAAAQRRDVRSAVIFTSAVPPQRGCASTEKTTQIGMCCGFRRVGRHRSVAERSIRVLLRSVAGMIFGRRDAQLGTGRTSWKEMKVTSSKSVATMVTRPLPDTRLSKAG